MSSFESVEDVLKGEPLDEVVDLVRKKYRYTSLLRNEMAFQENNLFGGHQADTNNGFVH